MNYVVERGMRLLPESSWRPVLQRSIDAFYDGQMREGIEACIALLQEPGIPDDVRDLTYRNQTFYASPLLDIAPSTVSESVSAPVPGGWGARDPSPVVIGNRLLVLVRAIPLGGDAVTAAETIAASTAISPEFVVLRDEDRGGPRLCDVRPFVDGEELRIAVIVRDHDGRSRDRAGFASLTPGGINDPQLMGPRYGNFHQGWLPLCGVDGMLFVANCEPTEIFRFEGRFVRVALRMAPHLAERFVAGSQGVAIDGGHLLLVNETIAFDDNELVFARFVRLDEGFQIDAVSPQFWIAQRGRDRMCGLARQDERLVIGFTSGDRATLATVRLDEVLAQLIPVTAPGKSRKEPRSI
jgi:hypothetical protein